ncbi:pyridoxal phosphate-dependent aminotransferase [Cellulosilyticum ruminicola]|uniref:pyridoxal phosphate-dependent aminotransferase n=1 Tax=Cellulosilyticum ruminicola TaxID=425254 RepID=UPI0006CF9FC0|nr:pyridoxal phosphate-dependent aminotransferase [Cellulosilyticum ruminicola]
MKAITKSTKLNNVHYEVRGAVVERADEMIASGIDVLKLNIGNPSPFGFDAPDEIIYDMMTNLRSSQGYSDSKGIFSGRKAIMQYCQSKNIPNVQIEDIYIGNGVSELILLSMNALLNPGDEILIPAPDYPLWTGAATLAGGKVVHYICDEQAEWYPDIDDIKAKITSRTRAIVIINPNNPTGALYPKEVLEQIVEVARQNDLLIFSDEIYDRLIMDNLEHVSTASLAPDLMVVTFNGLSKSHRICGFRVGWMCLSGDKSKSKGYIEGLNLLSSMRICANVPGQHIIQTALGGYQSASKLLEPNGRIYKQRDFITKRLNDIPGISAVKPKAAFYIFPKIDTKRYPIYNDENFALDFLEKEHILVIQGTGFNWPENNHFRLVYLPQIDQLSKAMDSLEHFLVHYRQ